MDEAELIVVGKRKRQEPEESESGSSLKKQGFYYSLRLYLNATYEETSGVLCMCIYHPLYSQQYDAMMKHFTEKSEILVKNFEEVRFVANDPAVKFDNLPPTISKRNLDNIISDNVNYSMLPDYPPRIGFSVRFRDCSISPKIKVLGLDTECEFNLVPSQSKTVNIPGIQQLFEEQIQVDRSQKFFAGSLPRLQPPQTEDNSNLAAVDNNTLDIDDLSEVLDAVETLSSKWRLLLTKLGLKQSTQDSIESHNLESAEMCLYKALGEWLRLNYDHQRHGKPSWRRLIKAVQSIDNELSARIAVTHDQASEIQQIEESPASSLPQLLPQTEEFEEETVTENTITRIAEAIQAAMAQNGIDKKDIPEEGLFDPGKESERYIMYRGTASFSCPNKHKWTASSFCFIDLKTQTICHQEEQMCMKCGEKITPKFTLPEMANDVVRDYLKKKEKQFVAGLLNAGEGQKKINRKHAHAMFIGPGDSGKSSLMYRLTGRRKLDSSSTGVAEPVAIVDLHTITAFAADKWKITEFNVSLVGQMHEHSHDTLPQPEDSLPKASITLESPQLETKSAPAISKPEKTNRFSKDDLQQILTQTVRNYGGYKNFETFLDKKFSLYLRDAGGQVEFQEMVSLLVYGPSFFIFAFKAYLGLKTRFPVAYRKDNGEVTNSYTSSVTTEEALLQCLASVYAMNTSQMQVKTHKPYVLVVATHTDKLGLSANQTINQLNKDLDKLIKDNGFKNLVQYADKGRVLFAVDNTAESDEDFKPIRKKIHNLITGRSEFNIEYPISYLLFCLALQKDRRDTLSLDQCREMAAKYGIVGDEVLHLLNFLHFRIGIIQFIAIEGVKPLVMKRPESLFNKVTDILIKTFPHDSFTTEEVGDLEKKGVLHESAFENVNMERDFVTPEEFIKILVHLHIITPLHNEMDEEKRYFLPCILNHCPEPQEEDDSESQVMPLAIKFKCKHCPKGLFGVLITYLLANTTTFKLKEDRIFKDQVSLATDFPGVRDRISLRAYPSHFEIQFFPEEGPEDEERHTPLHDVCYQVRQKIEDSIKKSIDTLHYNPNNVAPQFCLKCQHCSELHAVDIHYHMIHCDKTNKRVRLSEKEKIWFIKGGSGRWKRTSKAPKEKNAKKGCKTQFTDS